MGLDMYLRANEFVSRHIYSKDEDNKIAVNPNPIFNEIVSDFDVKDVIDPDIYGGITISFPMGYWRKANQIHKWFVDEIAGGEDNCQKMYVFKDRLEELRDLCQKVLDDNSLAEDLLPIDEGLFFGSYQYDEYYFGGLQETIEIINRCLKSKYEDFEYQASW